MHQHIVDAHRDQVNADGVVHLPFEGQLELGAHAVGTAHQYRLAIALGHLKQRAKAANAGQHALAHGSFGQRLDAFDQRITGVDIDPRVFVGKGSGGRSAGHVKFVLG